MSRSTALAAGMLAALVALAGCGRDPHAAVLEETLQAKQETLAILRTVQDEASLSAARDQLMRNHQRYEKIARKAQALRTPSGETRRQLEADFAEPMQQVVQQTGKELMRIKSLPGGEAFIDALDKLRETP